MRLTSLALTAVLALASALFQPALAQDEAALRAAAESYVSGPANQRMMDQILSPDTLIAQMRAANPNLTDEQLQLAAGIAAEELAEIRDDMEVATIEAAIVTFSLEEITALDAFYRTPEGMGVAGKMQPFMQNAFARMGPALQAAQGKIGARIMKAIAGQQ
jgi:hypothetical protein